MSTPRPSGDGNGRTAGFFGRQTIVLIAVIVVALLAGGLAGGELYARHRADDILVLDQAIEDGVEICVGDKVIGVANFMNTHVTLKELTVSPDGTRIGYQQASPSPAASTSNSASLRLMSGPHRVTPSRRAASRAQ
mgnify:CR=1 FL=1